MEKVESEFDIDQISFGTNSFADNPEPRCPCLLLLDTSASMSGDPINELNEGLRAFKEELGTDSLAMKRVEVSIITFGPVDVQKKFHSANDFIPPHLSTTSDTPMGAAILEGIDLVKQRKSEYRSNGIAFYRPWIFMITDGSPTDSWESAATAIKEGESSKSFAFFAVGVKGADIKTLKKISVREPLRLKGLKFRELFLWLSNSMKSVSRSVPGEVLALAPPTGWAEL